jgi:hypothetical protein
MARCMRCLLSLGMFGVLLLALGACDSGEGVIVATVTTLPPMPSTVTFAVSGGLSGTYTITSLNYMNSQP